MQKWQRSGAHDLAVNGTQSEKSKGKAFRFGIFGTRSGVQKVRFCPCLAMEISRIRVVWPDAADEAGGGRLRRVFCEQSLGKVGLGAGFGAKKAFLYYDTDFFGSLLPAG
jgi:hypothetical protein